MGALSSKPKEVRCGKCEKWQSAKYGFALAELAKPDGEEKHCYRCQRQQAWDEHLVSCAMCKAGLVHSTDYAERGLALPYASGCFKWDPGEERDEPLEGMGGLKAPARLNKKGGGSYDTRAKPGPAGLTLFCEYGRRRTEVVRGCGSLHSPTWEPEEGARVDCVRMAAEATQQDLRYLLEARNDMSIFFHKWDCSLYGKLSAIFVEGETVQVEREPYRKHGIGEFTRTTSMHRLFGWLRPNENQDLAGQRVFYGGWSGYSLPRKPQDPIARDEALSRASYYVADYDDNGRLAQFDKFLEGKFEWGDTYTYSGDGKLKLRIARMAPGGVENENRDPTRA